MSKHGENIRKRKDGRWEGRYIKGRKSDRTAIWGYIYGHSYNEVKEKLTIKKMEVQQFALNVENPTFSELSLTWESSIFLGVKSSTAAHYHYTLQHYILPVLGPYRVQALNESILESSLLEIIAPVDQNHKTLGNAMSKECLTLVRRICRYAVHLHIMRPVEIDLKLPTVNSSNTSVLNTIARLVFDSKLIPRLSIVAPSPPPHFSKELDSVKTACNTKKALSSNGIIDIRFRTMQFLCGHVAGHLQAQPQDFIFFFCKLCA